MKRFGFAILLALTLGWASEAPAANLGNFAPTSNICGKFTTYQPSTGAAFALAGTPALSVYKDDSTTQSTTGVTLTASFDSVTGLNHFCVDTSADGTFYSANSNFDVVITTGTVDSVSVVGSVVGSFTLSKATSSPTIGSIAEASFATTTGSVDALGISRQGTAQAATSTTVTLDASAPFASDTILGSTLWVRGSTNGNYWQAGSVTDFDGTTKVATVSFPSGFVTPTGTILFKMWGVAPGSSSGISAADVWSYGGGRTLSAATNITSTGGTIPISGGRVDSTVGAMQTDVITNTALASSAVTEIQAGLATAASITNLDGDIATLDSAVQLVKAKTDQLTFGVTNTLNVNVEYQNAAQVCGNGTNADKWRACP